MTPEEQWQALTGHGPAVPERFTQPTGEATRQAAPEIGGGEAGKELPPAPEIGGGEAGKSGPPAEQPTEPAEEVVTPVKQVSRIEPAEQPVTVINNYSYDYGLHYYPSREDDDSGPRYEQI